MGARKVRFANQFAYIGLILDVEYAFGLMLDRNMECTLSVSAGADRFWGTNRIGPLAYSHGLMQLAAWT
ncbi:hypothetical protein BCF46_3111 [Litoreibacter meonggei]|uniref:Uncharacterized protein n=1 Tax=Litoreibacter meonggei TaxID=1049199 RepID=A0A497VTG3_9RHOB|nr:hypothetical protein BCF46_3111 [Litoreibacter meonggei]